MFEMHLTYKPAIAFMCIHLIQNPYTIIASLFIIAKNWKQPRCPSTRGWLSKLWYIDTMEYCSAIKNIMNY